jgi:site-specific recombinase XerD
VTAADPVPRLTLHKYRFAGKRYACPHLEISLTTAKHPHNSNKGKKFKPDYLLPAEAQSIFDACPDNPTGIRNRALLVLMYRSGLRVDEALSLEMGSINLETRKIRLLYTKSGIAQTRGFTAEADEDLKRWLQKREELGLGPGAIFCTVNLHPGQRLSGRYMRWLTDDLRKKAGISKRVHPHIFRHSFANDMADKGFGPIVIGKVLGHKRPEHSALYIDHLTNDEAIKLMQSRDSSSPDGKKAPPLSEPEDWFDDYEEW